MCLVFKKQHAYADSSEPLFISALSSVGRTLVRQLIILSAYLFIKISRPTSFLSSFLTKVHRHENKALRLVIRLRLYL